MVSIGFRWIPVDSGEFPLGRLRWLPVIIFDGVLVALLTPTKGALKPLQNDFVRLCHKQITIQKLSYELRDVLQAE